jgi:hypothetical protein
MQIKTAFFAPLGCKHVWVVMPFGLRNAPVAFTAVMHDLKEPWESECVEAGINPSHDKGAAALVIDDAPPRSVLEECACVRLT